MRKARIFGALIGGCFALAAMGAAVAQQPDGTMGTAAPALDISGAWKGTGTLRDSEGVKNYTTLATNSFLNSITEQLLEDYQWQDPEMNSRPTHYKFVLRFSGPDFTIDPSEPGEYPQFTEAMGHCYGTGDVLPAGKNFCHHLRYMADGSIFQALIVKEDDCRLSIVRMQSKNGTLISTMESTYVRIGDNQCDPDQ